MESEVLQFISTYGYIGLALLLVIEGQVVGFIAGLLSALGVFNPFIVFGIYVAAMTISDSFLYWSAREGSSFLKRFKLTRRAVERVEAARESETPPGWVTDMREHFVKILVFAKLAPIVSLSETVIILAGLLRISPKRVYTAIFIGQPIWSAGIVALGYYFGDAINNPDRFFDYAWPLTIMFVALVIVYYRYVHEFMRDHSLGQLTGRLTSRSSRSK